MLCPAPETVLPGSISPPQAVRAVRQKITASTRIDFMIHSIRTIIENPLLKILIDHSAGKGQGDAGHLVVVQGFEVAGLGLL